MKIRKAVIPAAGFGTRFLPATKAQPKEMLNVVDKPLIQYSVEEAVGSGIEHIAIITSRGKSSIEDHFDQSPELEFFLEKKNKLDLLEQVKGISGLAEFCYIRQHQALGLGHAILMAESFIAGEPFAVLLPDDIFDCPVPCTKQLIDVSQEYEASVIVLGRTDEEGTKKYGIIKPQQVTETTFQVEDLVEKPGPEKAFSDLGVIGRYVFTMFSLRKYSAPLGVLPQTIVGRFRSRMPSSCFLRNKTFTATFSRGRDTTVATNSRFCRLAWHWPSNSLVLRLPSKISLKRYLINYQFSLLRTGFESRSINGRIVFK